MGVLTTNFHPNHINTSMVIPFLRSIIIFSGKRLLTPEAFHSLGVFFRGSYLMSIAAIKLLCHRSLFWSIAYFPSNRLFINVACHYLSSLQVSAPCAHWRPRNDFRKLGEALFTYGIKPEVGVLGV